MRTIEKFQTHKLGYEAKNKKKKNKNISGMKKFI